MLGVPSQQVTPKPVGEDFSVDPHFEAFPDNSYGADAIIKSKSQSKYSSITVQFDWIDASGNIIHTDRKVKNDPFLEGNVCMVQPDQGMNYPEVPPVRCDISVVEFVK